ncbi:MAG: hypothetical protein IMW89_20055 [Ktedonobacteraceae bacterium]|nr:hypothetical protein [Ktedonobacteraceae bacterium]
MQVMNPAAHILHHTQQQRLTGADGQVVCFFLAPLSPHALLISKVTASLH